VAGLGGLRSWSDTVVVCGTIILADDDTSDDDVIDLPVISMGLRDRPPYPVFEKMVPTVAHASAGLLRLEYRSPDGLAAIRFALDFGGERLRFDLTDGLFGHDDGSVEAARYRGLISFEGAECYRVSTRRLQLRPRHSSDPIERDRTCGTKGVFKPQAERLQQMSNPETGLAGVGLAAVDAQATVPTIRDHHGCHVLSVYQVIAFVVEHGRNFDAVRRSAAH
jgi:hypothetical protein